MSGPPDAHDYEALYASGRQPWDIGKAQPAFEQLVREGRVSGSVLDIGCGTGHHALLAARAGLDAVGIDIAPTAVGQARALAREQGVDARFFARDILELNSFGETFDCVLDCGFFHTLTNADRAAYLPVLDALTKPGSRQFLLAVSDKLPGKGGPRRLTEAVIASSFEGSWTIDSIEESAIETNLPIGDLPALLASMTRK